MIRIAIILENDQQIATKLKQTIMKARFTPVRNVFIIIGILLFSSCSKKGVKDNSILYGCFNTDKTSIVAGDTVHYQDLSIGYPQHWEWTFEGGSPATSTDQNPVVTYNDTGSYTVTLVVTSGTDHYTKQIKNYITVVPDRQINDDLIAYLSFDGTTADEGPNHLAIQSLGTLTYGT